MLLGQLWVQVYLGEEEPAAETEVANELEN